VKSINFAILPHPFRCSHIDKLDILQLYAKRLHLTLKRSGEDRTQPSRCSSRAPNMVQHYTSGTLELS